MLVQENWKMRKMDESFWLGSPAAVIITFGLCMKW